MEERVVIFIDGSNLYHMLKEEYPAKKVDYKKLADKMVNGRKLIRVYYYNSPLSSSQKDSYSKQQKFFQRIKELPYFEIKLGRLEKRVQYLDETGIKAKFGEEKLKTVIEVFGTKIEYSVEKGTDVNIAVDMLEYANRNAYDTAILVSADGDFARSVTAVKDLGKHVEVAATKRKFSYHLKNCCDKCVHLDDVVSNCFF
jgi:uncharacterized LabA/DUF88 family protein